MPQLRKIYFSKVFAKNYKNRIQLNKKLQSRYVKVFDLFLKDPYRPSLKNHKLQGSQRTFRAISIASDCRLIYFEDSRGIWLIDIGTHKQVYS